MGQLRKQQGVVLFIALIVLVALTMAGIALVRSVDTSNVIAGNLAFKQGTLQAADVGVEAAVSALPTILANWDNAHSGATYRYYPTRREDDTTGAPTAKEYGAAGAAAAIDWAAVPEASNVSGNSVRVVVDRLCQGPPPVTDIQGKCFAEDPQGGGTKKVGGVVFSGSAVVYYRVTVRVVGPRNTTSMVQAIISR